MKKLILVLSLVVFALVIGNTSGHCDYKPENYDQEDVADKYMGADEKNMKLPYRPRKGDLDPTQLAGFKKYAHTRKSTQACLSIRDLAVRDDCLRDLEVENLQALSILVQHGTELCARRYTDPANCRSQVARLYEALVHSHQVIRNLTIGFQDDPDKPLYDAVNAENAVVNMLIFIGGMQQTFP